MDMRKSGAGIGAGEAKVKNLWHFEKSGSALPLAVSFFTTHFYVAIFYHAPC
jgi:hypothetical protein